MIRDAYPTTEVVCLIIVAVFCRVDRISLLWLRIRHWGFVSELNRYLRVVTLEDGVTIHNAFPDRRFKP